MRLQNDICKVASKDDLNAVSTIWTTLPQFAVCTNRRIRYVIKAKRFPTKY